MLRLIGIPQAARAKALSSCGSALARFASTKPAVEENDDRMIGPYPHVKFEYYNERPQDVKYDDQQGRRNFGEPLHHKFDLIDVWSPDHFSQRSDCFAVTWTLGFVGLIAAFSGFCYYVWEGPNFVRRQYPYGGLYKALGGDEKTKELYRARPDESADSP